MDEHTEKIFDNISVFNSSTIKTSKVTQSDISENIGNFLFEITALIIAIIGVCGNLLGVVFLLHRKVKHSFHVFMTSLMITDLAYLIIALLQSLLNILPYFSFRSVFTILYPVAVRLKIVHIMLFSTSAFTITCMSIERLLRIRFPLTSKKLNRKSALILTLTGIVLNTAVLIPIVVLQETPKVSENTTSFTTSVLKWKVEGGSSKRKIYVTIVIALTRLLPAAITFIANVFLITVLLKRRPRRAFLFANRISRNDRRRFDDFGTTLTLILISVFLLLSLVPSATVQALANHYPNTYLNENRIEHTHYKATIAFGRFISVFSAANDFVVYILMSKRSRIVLKNLLFETWCSCF